MLIVTVLTVLPQGRHLARYCFGRWFRRDTVLWHLHRS
jgi:hypothetical protein